MRDETPLFLKRIKSREPSQPDVDSAPVVRQSRWTLKNAAYLAQIVVVIVAIFGYFYQVLPTYQKERLAEEVAHLEGRLSEASADLLIAEKESETYGADAVKVQAVAASLQAEMKVQVNALARIKQELARIKQERDSTKRQIEFMDYTHRFPDGSPADSEEKVASVRYEQYRADYFSRIQSAYYLKRVNEWPGGNKAGDPFTYLSPNYDKDSEASIFRSTELGLWQEHGRNYPVFAAIELIENTSHPELTAALESDDPVVTHEDVDSWKQEGIAHVRSLENTWEPPINPEDVVSKLQKELDYIDDEMRQVAGVRLRRYQKKRIDLITESADTTNEFRTSINDEVHKLLGFESLNLPPNNWDQTIFP